MFAGAAALVVLTACGGASGSANPTAAVRQATVTAVLAPTPPSTPATATATPVPTPTQSAVLPSTPTPVVPVSSAGGDLLVLGKEVFEKKAGNVGCQACHGIDAKGVVGPNIRGKTADDIRKALKEVDLMMQTVKNLDDRDIEAVAAYLRYLTTQP